jgi:hypothetical protein
MPARNAARRTTTSLPAEPPALQIQAPPARPAGVFDSTLPIRERCFVGDPKHPTGTARHVLQTSWVRGGNQRLLFIGRGRWFAWSDMERAWNALDEEAVEAFVYRALSDNRWNSSPKHVAAILRVFRLQLYWPQAEMRCTA